MRAAPKSQHDTTGTFQPSSIIKSRCFAQRSTISCFICGAGDKNPIRFPILAVSPPSIQPERSHHGPPNPLPRNLEAEISICQARGLCNELVTIHQLHDIIVTLLADLRRFAFQNSGELVGGLRLRTTGRWKFGRGCQSFLSSLNTAAQRQPTTC